jgi:tetratricopeptide (TPR) repeat protein
MEENRFHEDFVKLAKAGLRDDYGKLDSNLDYHDAFILENMNKDIKKLVDQFEKQIPEILQKAVFLLRKKLKLNIQERDLLAAFLEKIDPPSTILESFTKNEKESPQEEKFYILCGIEYQEIEAVYKLAINLLNENEYKNSTNLFDLLVLIDRLNLNYRMGLGISIFLSAKKGDISTYSEAYKVFYKAHEIDPTNNAPVVGIIESLIGMERYKEAKNIIHQFADKKDLIDEHILKVYKQLNGFVVRKLQEAGKHV